MFESKSYIAVPPGAAIEEQMKAQGIALRDFAQRMRLSEVTARQLLQGEVPLSFEMAERLAATLGVPATFWNRLEAIYQEKRRNVIRENERDKENRVLAHVRYAVKKESFA